MAQHYDLTSVGVNPADDRSRRMKVYFIAMTVRIACVASLFFVRGWWIILVGLAAVILPYFAVIYANERATTARTRPDQPAPQEITSGHDHPVNTAKSTSESVVVVDAPADRRATREATDETAMNNAPQVEETRE